jgi:predicted nucleic acid-binding protein
VHEAVWRGKTSNAQAEAVLSQLVGGRIEVRTHRRLGARAWEIADELGWAKTYDAEYVALASLLGCRLVTVDGRLRRGAARLGFVIGPDEL